jgi:hypothetical protein
MVGETEFVLLADIDGEPLVLSLVMVVCVGAILALEDAEGDKTSEELENGVELLSTEGENDMHADAEAVSAKAL